MMSAEQKIDKLLEEANRFEREFQKKYRAGNKMDAINMIRKNEATRAANLKDGNSPVGNRDKIVKKLTSIPLMKPETLDSHFKELTKLDRIRKNDLRNYNPSVKESLEYSRRNNGELERENKKYFQPPGDNQRVFSQHDGGYYFLDGLVNRKNKAHLKTAGSYVGGNGRGLFVRTNPNAPVGENYIDPNNRGKSLYSNRAYYQRGDFPATLTSEIETKNFMHHPLYTTSGNANKPSEKINYGQDAITQAKYVANNPTTKVFKKGDYAELADPWTKDAIYYDLTDKEKKDLAPWARKEMGII